MGGNHGCIIVSHKRMNLNFITNATKLQREQTSQALEHLTPATQRFIAYQTKTVSSRNVNIRADQNGGTQGPMPLVSKEKGMHLPP
jgi:hypothetical protein